MTAADLSRTEQVRASSTKPPGLLCLEGEWEDDDPWDKLSVEHVLRLLELQNYLRLVHRNVNTVAELEYHISRMSYRKKPRYDIVYLAFHGDRDGFDVGKEAVSLDSLASMLSQQEPGFVVYIASCSVLNADAAQLMSFCRKSGARAVAGYTRNVDWTESSAFELMMISSLLGSTSIKPLHDRLVREHPALTQKLGFRMAHRTWASAVGS
nr:DUF6642 family protein [uncultured Rhodococcus sp.]